MTIAITKGEVFNIFQSPKIIMSFFVVLLVDFLKTTT